MEEIEVPTEHLHQHMEHAAHEAHERWLNWVALSSALLAVLAAVTALLAGKHANEAMIEQMKATDQWSYYQAKSIKAALLESKIDTLTELGKTPAEADRTKVETYRADREKISEGAKELEHSSAYHLERHEVFARGVTFFQVAIGIAAIAALTRRRVFWFVGMGFGLIGTVFLALGLFR